MSTQKNSSRMTCLVAVVGVSLLLSPLVSFAATATTTKCTFTRNLELGVTGDDVLCLQKYLNANGFVIAASGVGSPGHETGEYKTLTEAAVIKWQKANKLTPAIGYFGAQSRLFFKTGSASLATTVGTPAVNAPLIQVPAAAQSTDPDAVLAAQVAALKAQLEAAASGKPVSPVVTPSAVLPVVTPATTAAASVVTSPVTTGNAADAAVRTSMRSILDLLTKADKAVKKGTKSTSLTAATLTLATAKDDMLLAVRTYLSGDLASTTEALARVKKSTTKAMTAISAASDKTRATKALSNAKDNYESASDEITTADDDGETVTVSKKLLKKAATQLDDAQVAIDDEEFSDALDILDEAETNISDAVDKIGKKS